MLGIIDLHTHHYRCGHATGTLCDYIEAAVRKGIRTIGLSDHAPLFAHKDEHPVPGIQMAKHEFSAYLSEATELKHIYSDRIEVLVGTECDYLPGTEDIYRRALQDERLDYVIGSVHEFDGFHVFKPSTWQEVEEPAEVYRRYYSAVKNAAESGLFDVVAHFDAIRAMGPSIDCSIIPIIQEAMEAIAQSGMAVEINTSGMRKSNEAFPSASFVKILHSMNVPFTFGSDSHSPDEVGYGWGDVSCLLSEIGVQKLVSFKKRQQIRVDIPF